MIASDTGPFSLVPDWVLNLPLSDKAVRLYAVLGRFADTGGTCNPSRQRLADRMRCSLDSVDRAKDELVRYGALKWEPTVRPGKKERGSNMYVLCRVAPSDLAAATRPPSRTHAATVAAPMRQELEPSELEPLKFPIASDRRKPLRPIPIPFELSDDQVAWAEQNCPGVDWEFETQQFCDWMRAKDVRYRDWPMAWRTWMRKADKRQAALPRRPNLRPA